MTDQKTLMLLRHAHSGAAQAPFGPDHDRVLTKRGIRACNAMASWMKQSGCIPAMVHCSTAARAQETWDRIRNRFDDRTEITETRTRDLYLAEPVVILRQLAQTPDDVSSAMIVAHNPGIAELALHLAMRSPGADIGDMAMKYPTAALAVFRFTGSWASLNDAKTVLQHYIVPRALPAEG